MAKPRPYQRVRKSVTLRGSVQKRWQGAMGGWRRNGLKARHMNQGCLHGVRERAEHRVPVVVRKRRNGCGAKGDREVDA